MKTFVVLALDARRPKADGTCPILLRIIHYGKPSPITTGIYIKEADWDANKRCIKPSYRGTESVTRLNNRLLKKKAEAIDIITKLDEQRKLNTLTVYDLKKLIERKPTSASFYEFAQRVISDLKEANRIGTAETHETAIRALKAFNGDKDLAFYEINLDFLNRMEVQHLKRGNSYNGLSVCLRSVRSLFNQAIKAQVVEQDLYPFKAYVIKSNQTRKRAIKLDGIQRIEALNYEPGHPLFNSRNYFLLSFYLRGMTFADIAYLKREQVIDGYIHYKRKKTGRPYAVKILSPIVAIINHYLHGKQPEEFIFPILHGEKAAEHYKSLKWARKRYNRKLDQIGKECGIEEHLTSYVSRHSFATRAKNLGIDTASISDMLGHGDLKTTQVYLESLPSDLLDDLHEKTIRDIPK